MLKRNFSIAVLKSENVKPEIWDEMFLDYCSKRGIDINTASEAFKEAVIRTIKMGWDKGVDQAIAIEAEADQRAKQAYDAGVQLGKKLVENSNA